jgi:hypothetical protein
MIDGPYTGWKPTPQDWCQIKFGRVLYVDKDGLLSPMETNRGPHPKFRANEGYKDHQSPTSESRRETYPAEGPMVKDDPTALRQMFAMGGPTGYGAILPEGLTPTNFFVNSPGFSGSPATSASPGSSGPGPDMMKKIDGVNGGIDGARITEGFSPILPMELMIYNDLMTDIGGTARVLGQEFRDSVLFCPAPTSSPTPAGQHPDQGPGSQPSSTMYEWVLPSVQFARRRC